MMTINVAGDDGADTDDDNNYKYYSISEQQCWHSRWSPPKENSNLKRLERSMIAHLSE